MAQRFNLTAFTADKQFSADVEIVAETFMDFRNGRPRAFKGYITATFYNDSKNYEAQGEFSVKDCFFDDEDRQYNFEVPTEK